MQDYPTPAEKVTTSYQITLPDGTVMFYPTLEKAEADAGYWLEELDLATIAIDVIRWTSGGTIQSSHSDYIETIPVTR